MLLGCAVVLLAAFLLVVLVGLVVAEPIGGVLAVAFWGGVVWLAARRARGRVRSLRPAGARNTLSHVSTGQGGVVVVAASCPRTPRCRRRPRGGVRLVVRRPRDAGHGPA